ncbi:MAG: 4'-phosphopantetheinyl transferase superfamily protein [Ferruginibacter sp.]|nr:4'-phosphopantetheinyl transferase superfamily protein [Ferruginibacter sp.]
MPLVYQQNINATTKIAVWHITEPEDFFLTAVPVQREIKHWHKRLQHLAGRLLLKELYPDFPVELIQIADTKKPFLENEPFHFSISHCGDYAAAIVSKTHRVGVDVEQMNDKIERIQHKFTGEEELEKIQNLPAGQAGSKFKIQNLTLCWSIKESVFKWWGRGEVDFKKDILIKSATGLPEQGVVECIFKNEYDLDIHYLFFSNNYLTWVLTKK